jgi:hypothetical protein
MSAGQNISYNFNLKLEKNFPYSESQFWKIVKMIFFDSTSTLSQISLAANLVCFIASRC